MQIRKCYFCNYKSMKPFAAERHLRLHTKETPYFCREKNCRAMFTRKESLVEHRKKKHKLWNIQTRESATTYDYYFCSYKMKGFSSLVTHLLVHTGERPFKCSFTKCKKYYHTKTHQRTHSVVCDYNPELKINLAKRKEKHTQILIQCRFQCYFCRKNFTSSSRLFYHIKAVHLGEQHKRCVGCKRKFKYQDMSDHVKNCLDIRNRFSCNFCHVSKASKNRLNYHIQSVHTKDLMKSKCYFCNREVDSNQMASHLPSHTKEIGNKCHHCQVYFATRHGLRHHLGVRHADTEEGAVIRKTMQRKCYFCHRYFANSWNLRNHMLLHTKETG